MTVAIIRLGGDGIGTKFQSVQVLSNPGMKSPVLLVSVTILTKLLEYILQSMNSGTFQAKENGRLLHYEEELHCNVKPQFAGTLESQTELEFPSFKSVDSSDGSHFPIIWTFTTFCKESIPNCKSSTRQFMLLNIFWVLCPSNMGILDVPKS